MLNPAESLGRARRAIFGEPLKKPPFLKPTEVIFPHAKMDFSQGVFGRGPLDLHNAIVKGVIKFGSKIELSLPKPDGGLRIASFVFLMSGAMTSIDNSRIPHTFLSQERGMDPVIELVIPDGTEWAVSEERLMENEVRNLYRNIRLLQQNKNK